MPVLPSFSQHTKRKLRIKVHTKVCRVLGSHSGVLEVEVVQEAFFDCMMLKTKTLRFFYTLSNIYYSKWHYTAVGFWWSWDAYSHRFANHIVVVWMKLLAKANFLLPRNTNDTGDSLIVLFVMVKLVNWGTQHISTTQLAETCDPIYESSYIQKYGRLQVLTAVFQMIK